MIAIGFLLALAPAASAETRSLKLFFIHTKEKAEIVFKRNGRYDQDGLRKINRFLRDWRRNEPTKMDPRLLDLVWEAYKQTGGRDYIHVVSAYRSPATNSMLRKRSKGVANKSQHMLGKAMDFYIPGVKLQNLRNVALRLQGGGVGYYPRSGAPFVHMDVGNVRHWPRMSRKELVAVFPNGKTLHVPSDGKPLPGFEQAVASYKSRQSSGYLAAIASASTTSGSGKRSGGLLAAFFGGGADEEEDSSGAAEAVAVATPKTPAKKPEPAPVVVAAQPEPEPVKPAPEIRVVPPELATPATPVVEEPETIIAALPARQVPVPLLAPRPSVDVGALAEEPATVAAIPAEDPEAKKLDEGEVELALNVPLPTWRPNYTPPAELAAPQAKDPALLALLEQDADGAAAEGLPVPEARPVAATAEDAMNALTVASLPENGPLLQAQPAVAVQPTIGGIPGKALDAAALLPPSPRPETASPKAAIVALGETDPSVAPAPGVKTTAKGGKPGRRDKRPDPRPIVVSAQPDAARWAFDNNYVADRTAGTTAPSLAYNIVRTAPREVYTAGFGAGDQNATTNKFTGKAVTFLSVARFETN